MVVVHRGSLLEYIKMNNNHFNILFSFVWLLPKKRTTYYNNNNNNNNNNNHHHNKEEEEKE